MKLQSIHFGVKIIIKIFIIILLASYVFPHSIDDKPTWTQYYRLGYILTEEEDSGIGGYFRFKRVTQYTFRDLRAYLNFNNNNSYKKIRYKSSNKFIEFSKLYNYSSISIDQNSKVGVDIRYHGNQGIGFFINQSQNGHIHTEFGLAYDISDYLNDSRKTSYIKNGLYWDSKYNNIELKLEVENFYQITDLIDNIDLSRLELLFELYFHINNNLKIILGYELENFKTSTNQLNPSVFLSIGYSDTFNINKLKNKIIN